MCMKPPGAVTKTAGAQFGPVGGMPLHRPSADAAPGSLAVNRKPAYLPPARVASPRPS